MSDGDSDNKDGLYWGREEVIIDIVAQDERTLSYLKKRTGFEESHCLLPHRELVLAGLWTPCWNGKL